MPQKILFIDRDGVLIDEPADEQIDSFEKFRLTRGCIAALQKLRDAGFQFVMVSNQDGLGTSSFPRETFEGPQRLLLQILESQGITFREILIDESFARENLPTRKPGIGMVMHYLRDRDIELANSAMVGACPGRNTTSWRTRRWSPDARIPSSARGSPAAKQRTTHPSGRTARAAVWA